MPVFFNTGCAEDDEVPPPDAVPDDDEFCAAVFLFPDVPVLTLPVELPELGDLPEPVLPVDDHDCVLPVGTDVACTSGVSTGASVSPGSGDGVCAAAVTVGDGDGDGVWDTF